MENENIKVALFIPTYNVDAKVVSVLEAIPESFYSRLYAIYIYDNKSSDQTLVTLKKYVKKKGKEKFQLFQNEDNYLLGGSTVMAFNQAILDNIDYLICMHSDGQADPQFLLEFDHYLGEGYDFILGSRFLKNSQVEDYSRVRYLFNVFFSYLQWIILKQKVFDIGAFIGFRIETIKQIPFREISADMGYHPYLIMVASRLIKRKLKFKEFPISWGKVEDSHINVIKYGLIHLSRIIRLFCGSISYQNLKYKSQRINTKNSLS